MIIFELNLLTFLIECHFFEAAGAVVKIGSILKPKTTIRNLACLNPLNAL